MSATSVRARAETRPGRAAAAEAARASFWLGLREVRTVLRYPGSFVPNLLMPLVFYFVMVGSISGLAAGSGLANYEAFQLPSALVIAVMSGSAGLNMVTDIDGGYFDKLLLTPVSRLSLLVGAMGADMVRIFVQGLLVAGVALATGVEFATGLPGALAVVAIGTAWGIAYSAVGFGVALKTGSVQATQNMWALFLPLFFLTSSFAPEEALSGWLATAAAFNPMTYVLRGMRALSMAGWDGGAIAGALLAIAALAAVTFTFALRALLARVR